MSSHLAPLATAAGPEVQFLSWFCVQTHPKHEQIAAEHLRKSLNIETFNPRFRYQQPTRRGLVWFTESLFPGYIFARFNIHWNLDGVRYSPSVSQVVRFGSGYPVVPDDDLEYLKAEFGDGRDLAFPQIFSPGDAVRVVSGAFRDLTAVVQRVIPGRQRVQVLFEVLGRVSTVELDALSIVHEEKDRLRLRV